jgi:(2Fe-2S) ferredoxin
VFVVDFTCFGYCDDGPNLLVRSLEDGENGEDEPAAGAIGDTLGLYSGVDAERLDQVIDEHCRTGEPIKTLVRMY